MQSVLITGASSGIGLATAHYFAERGWKVFATSRNPDLKAKPTHPNLCPLALDVTKPETIASALVEVQRQSPTLDVLVNNAGYGLAGVFEACTAAQIRKQFETNFFGLTEVTRAVLPIFRKQRRGVIVNISSVGGRTTIPLYSLYHATKFAVEGFSESLQYELEPFGIRVKLVEPGAVKTDFAGRSADFADIAAFPDYAPYQTRVIDRLKQAADRGAPAEEVARDIFRAANDRSARLRFPSGNQSKFFLSLQKVVPNTMLRGLIRRSFG